MANKMQTLGSIVLIYCWMITATFGLYEDQIGKLDWRHQYIGQVKFVDFDNSASTGKRIIVGTEQNVIASLTVRTGEIGWRHVMERGQSGKINDMVLEGSSLIVVSGGGQFIRSFNPSMGNLLWEASIEHEASNHRAKLLVVSENTITVLTKSSIQGFNMDTGAKRWSHSLPNSDIVTYTSMYEKDGLVTVIGQSPGSHSTVVTFTEMEQKSEDKVPAPWINTNTMCEVTYNKVVLCLDPYSRTLHLLNQISAGPADKPQNSYAFSPKLLQELGLTGHQEVLLYQLQQPQEEDAPTSLIGLRLGSRHIAVLNVLPSGITLLRDFPQASAVQLVQYGEQHFLLSFARKDDELKLQAYDALTGAELTELSLTMHFAAHHGLPKELYSHVFKKRDGTMGVRVVLLSQDHSIALLQQSGKVAWAREEALASIITMEMVDLPVSQLQQEMEEEFAQNGGQYDILAMFARRFHSQFNQLKAFILHLKSNLKVPRHGHTVTDEDMEEENDESDITKEEYLTRDEFNIHKMIVAVSSAGKIFGIDGFTGRPVWRYLLGDMAPFERYGEQRIPLFVQRTTAHVPHLPQCTVIGKHRLTGQTLLFSFNPIAGTPSDEMPPGGIIMNYDVKQVTMLPALDEHFLRPLVLLDNALQYHVYPESGIPLVEEYIKVMFMYTVDVDTGMLRGYGMKHGPLRTLAANELWSVNLQRDSQIITNVVSKRSIEQVHSQGIVLGDRSVLFKYLNPNLIVVTAEGIDPSQKGASFVNVYLIDVVSGNIVFHCNHKKAKGPVHIVHSENWVVYNYWNQKFRRNEMAVLEMYEGQKQNNASAFSSLTMPALPIVMRQAYIFPGYISHMAATITEKGITNKHILIAMEAGGILEMPKALLDPRRPFVLTQEHKEEGMIPYIPELPRHFEAVINYNQTLHNIRGIATAPAGLESTCLVVSYGLDLFGTRVMPSKMFDVLKEDFDYVFIALVLLGMILVSFITQKLATRKALKRAWR